MVEQPHYRAVRALNVTDDIDIGFQIPPRLPAKRLVGLLLLPLRILSCRTYVHVVECAQPDEQQQERRHCDHSGLPVAIQFRKTAIRSGGQAPSQGMLPASRRCRIASACRLTSV